MSEKITRCSQSSTPLVDYLVDGMLLQTRQCSDHSSAASNQQRRASATLQTIICWTYHRKVVGLTTYGSGRYQVVVTT